MENLHFSKLYIRRDELVFLDSLFHDQFSDPEFKPSREAVKDMLYTYYNMKQRKHPSLDNDGIICYILMKYYFNNVRDSSLIAEALMNLTDINDYIFERSETKGNYCYFCFDFFLNIEKHAIRKEVITKVKQKTFIHYILYHTNKARFVASEERMSRLLFENMGEGIASNSYEPNNFILLLKYGGDFEYQNICPYPEYNYYIMFFLISNIWKTYWRDGKDITFICNDKNVLCLSYLLRVIPCLSKGITELIMKEETHIDLENITEKLAKSNILPILKYRLQQPSDLKNLCRFNIRRILWKKWNLPNGINKLQVPSVLKDYLNLSVE